MKKCPFCAEDILDEAIKCKHCGSSLIASGVQQQNVQTYVKNPRAGKNKMLLSLPVIFVGFIIMGAANGNAVAVGIGILVFLVGLGVAFYGKSQHWFHWE